jgi:hypothetical protein
MTVAYVVAAVCKSQKVIHATRAQACAGPRAYNRGIDQ